MPIIDLPSTILERLDQIGLEPLKRFQFAVQFDADSYGTQYVMGFDSVSGIGDTIEVRDIKEGGYPGIHRFPRKSQLDQIVLSKAMTFGDGLWHWFDEVRIPWVRGKPNYARTLSVSMLDIINPTKVTGGEPIQFEVWRFDIVDAWPSSWKASELSAYAEERLLETITLQHGGISKAKSLFSQTVVDAASLLGQR